MSNISDTNFGICNIFNTIGKAIDSVDRELDLFDLKFFDQPV